MKRFLLNSIVVAALGVPALALAQQTTTFTFDPTGTAGAAGDIGGAATLDQSPGNALSIGAIPAQVGGTTTLLYQANLGTINNANGTPIFTNGNGNRHFTFVAGFNETFASLANNPGGTQTATFNLAPTAPNFFYMYATAAPGDNLAGTGFTTGTRILSGTINAAGFSSNFTANNADRSPFDSYLTNNYPGVTSVTGSGASRFSATITSFDPLYFPSFNASNLTLSFFNTSQITPFNQVDPSALFSSNGIANGDRTANRGAINGVTGPDFQFQADANTSFQVSAIPEPETYALMLGGLGFIGFMARRRKLRS